MEDFRQIGDLAVELIGRIRAGDLPLWSDDVESGGAAMVPDKGHRAQRCRKLVVIRGGGAGTPPAATGHSAPPAPLRLIMGGKAVHGYARSSTG